jgi:uncharacterized coiled-coil protein SlyX
MKTLTKIIYPVFPVLALLCFGLVPKAHAVNPPPDGGYANFNTAEGDSALFSLTNGSYNTAVGFHSLWSDTIGNYNTANGAGALLSNITGSYNTATGEVALERNTTGSYNTAGGVIALYYNNGSYNTANGYLALFNNTIGNYNTADGANALYGNTTGSSNTANGANALYANTTGSSNVAIGANAGKNLTIGSGNVCVGVNVLGVAGESNTTRIGNIYSSIANGRAVYVNSDNKIGTLASSRRFKEEIKPMGKASEAILALKPVTFRYKKEIDASRTKQFGLIAEQVEKVNPDLVTRDEEGKPETVRYDAVNAMLLNEFLKEHRKVQEQEAAVSKLTSTVAEQEAMGAQQQKELKDLTATVKGQALEIQKISAQLATASPPARGLEASKPAPKIVFNDE